MQKENQLKSCCKKCCFPVLDTGSPALVVSDRWGNLRKEIGRCRITTLRQNTDFNVGLTPDLYANLRCSPYRSGVNPTNWQGVGPVFARPARTGAPLRSGFTLIELLVVVLIIGILAAVALPQYKLAVDKARLSNLVTMAKSVMNAQEAYYLANGAYTNDWDSLAISFTGTVSGQQISSGSWMLRLVVGGPNALQGHDSKLPGMFLYAFYKHGNELVSQSPAGGGISCYAVSDNAQAVKLCKNVTHKTTRDDSAGTYDVYKLE